MKCSSAKQVKLWSATASGFFSLGPACGKTEERSFEIDGYGDTHHYFFSSIALRKKGA